MSILSSRPKVAVIRGGPSSEYEVSLKSGANILSLLREMPEQYEPIDLFISREGEWHRSGLVEEPHHALRHVDIVFNALHGSYGEDGKLQQLLEALNIPFTGSGVLGSAMAANKEMAKKIYREHSLSTPQFEVMKEPLNHEQLIHIFRNYLHPVIIKPTSGGSSIGMSMVHTFKELEEAVKRALKHSEKILIEEFIKGKTSTCGIVEKARGEQLYCFVPVGNSSVTENKQMAEMARQAHQLLGLRHYSSSDFIITPKGRIYILETDSLPVFHEGSVLHSSMEATGWRPREFVDHCVKLALNRV